MPPPPDPTIERHRQRLDESLAKLRKALRHWQVLSAEYEGFREELQALPDGASREEMVSFLSFFFFSSFALLGYLG